MLTGARQVGETIFLQNLATTELIHITLDDPVFLDMARRYPALFMQLHPALLIDEIQYAPKLLPFIKMAGIANG